jgi:hypothetical protein
VIKNNHIAPDQKIELFKERWSELLHDETPLSIRAQPNTRHTYVLFLENLFEKPFYRKKFEFVPDQLKLSGNPNDRIKELVKYAYDLHDFDIAAFDPCRCRDYDVVSLADEIVRSSIEEGFHALYLHNVISLPELTSQPSTNANKDMLFESFIHELLRKLRERKTPRDIDVYARIGGSGRYRGTKYQWHQLPDSVTVKFQGTDYIPNTYDEDAQNLRFLMFSVKARDPYSAVHKAYEEYRLMFTNINITKKRKSSGKNVHYLGRNEGGSPVTIGDPILVDDSLTLEEFSLPEFARVLKKPPYQRLKTNVDDVRGHFERFGHECPVFRALADCYSRAVWCIKDSDIEGVFQNLAVGIDLSFREKIDVETDEKGPDLFIDLGSLLLTLDYPRSYYEWLTRHLSKRMYPGKSIKEPKYDIYEIITQDRQWNVMCSGVRIPELLKYHRYTLMLMYNDLAGVLEKKRKQYRTELNILRESRNKWAHTAERLVEPYYLSMIIEYFRLILEFRFSAYYLFKKGNSPTDAGLTMQKFFAEKTKQIKTDFKKIPGGEGWTFKELVHDGGYVSLGIRRDDTRDAAQE